MTKMSESEPQILAKGYTSTIYYHPDATKVIKVLDSTRAKAQAHLEVERRVYERLILPDRPISIIQYFGTDSTHRFGPGLVLERAELGSVYDYLYHDRTPIEPYVKYNWTRQAALALSFVHRNGILHCDVHAANLFLDGKLGIKLGDFGAASIEGERPLMMYRASHQLWVHDDKTEWRRDISIASEVFALGCVLYNIETRNGLFKQEERKTDEAEITRRLKEKDIPDLDTSGVLNRIIGKCWSLQYQSMQELIDDVSTNKDEADSTTSISAKPIITTWPQARPRQA